jgi:hypothetical protein
VCSPKSFPLIEPRPPIQIKIQAPISFPTHSQNPEKEIYPLLAREPIY